MRNTGEKKKIIKIRPFNMANFSGGSGYLVFSLIYQAMAIFPAMVIIWFISLIKLPKHYGTDITDSRRAAKRYYAVSIPLCVITIIIGIVLACVWNYGTFGEYWIEIFIVGIVPSVCMFFIMRCCHRKIVEEDANTVAMIALSFFFTLISLVLILVLCALILDPILTAIAEQLWESENGF